MRRTFPVSLVGAAILVSGFASAGDTRGRDATRHAVVFKVPSVKGLRLFLRDKEGVNYGSLDAVDAAVAASGHKVVFAMNAGMYEADRSPTGLFVQESRQVAPLNVQQRPQDKHTPNFYLSPNGVFALAPAGPAILSTAQFSRSPPKDLTLATQSGPLLLAGGAIVSPAVSSGTDAEDHRNRRNGICVNGKSVVLVEVDAMTLHQFAIYLRDIVGCVDALYMDGAVSSVHDARTGRRDRVDARNPLGPIIAYVE
jgi:uncharacterized protein YigE (DUF2233 family)